MAPKLSLFRSSQPAHPSRNHVSSGLPGAMRSSASLTTSTRSRKSLIFRRKSNASAGPSSENSHSAPPLPLPPPTPSSPPTAAKSILLELTLTSTSFLDAQVLDSISKKPLYIVSTAGTSSTFSRADQSMALHKVADVKWPKILHIKTSRSESSGVLVRMKGRSWMSGEELLIPGTSGTSFKFLIPGYSRPLKWKQVGRSYTCTTPAVTGPIAILYSAVGSTPPRFEIFESLRDKQDNQTALILTDVQEWLVVRKAQDRKSSTPNNSSSPAISIISDDTASETKRTPSEQWRKIAYGEPMYNKQRTPSALSRSSLSHDDISRPLHPSRHPRRRRSSSMSPPYPSGMSHMQSSSRPASPASMRSFISPAPGDHQDGGQEPFHYGTDDDEDWQEDAIVDRQIMQAAAEQTFLIPSEPVEADSHIENQKNASEYRGDDVFDSSVTGLQPEPSSSSSTAPRQIGSTRAPPSPHSPSAESVFYPVSPSCAPSHTYIDPGFYNENSSASPSTQRVYDEDDWLESTIHASHHGPLISVSTSESSPLPTPQSEVPTSSFRSMSIASSSRDSSREDGRRRPRPRELPSLPHSPLSATSTATDAMTPVTPNSDWGGSDFLTAPTSPMTSSGTTRRRRLPQIPGSAGSASGATRQQSSPGSVAGKEQLTGSLGFDGNDGTSLERGGRSLPPPPSPMAILGNNVSSSAPDASGDHNDNDGKHYSGFSSPIFTRESFVDCPPAYNSIDFGTAPPSSALSPMTTSDAAASYQHTVPTLQALPPHSPLDLRTFLIPNNPVPHNPIHQDASATST